MQINILIISFFTFLVACAPVNSNQYKVWSSLPTPEIWKPNSIWNLVMLDQKGVIIKTLTVKFTDQAAETCSSGKANKIEILFENPKRLPTNKNEPAYYLRGSALKIDLASNICDDSYDLSGQLSEFGFEGVHQPVTMYGGKIVGRFYGTPVNN